MTEIDRSLVGRETEPFTVEVERGAIRRFAEAIGDANPLAHDPAFARRHGYPDVVAPPTFPTTFRPPEDPPWIRTLDRQRIVAGEMAFALHRPIVAGMVLTCRMRLKAVDERAGSRGVMELLRQDLEGHDPDGALVFVAGRTTVYRPAGQSLA